MSGGSRGRVAHIGEETGPGEGRKGALFSLGGARKLLRRLQPGFRSERVSFAGRSEVPAIASLSRGRHHVTTDEMAFCQGRGGACKKGKGGRLSFCDAIRAILNNPEKKGRSGEDSDSFVGRASTLCGLTDMSMEVEYDMPPCKIKNR